MTVNTFEQTVIWHARPSRVAEAKGLDNTQWKIHRFATKDREMNLTK